MKKIVAVSSLLASLFGASGCAVEATEEPPGEAPAFLRALAVVPTATGEIVFFDATADGRPQIDILESGDRAAGATPLQRALREVELTSLEIFLAVTDAEPPALLEEAHPFEAASLGREDDSVIELAIDVNAPVEKSFSAAECDEVVFWDDENDRVNTRSWNNQTTNGARFEYGHVAHDRVRFGFCNDKSEALSLEYQHKSWPSGSWRIFLPSEERWRRVGGNQFVTYSTDRGDGYYQAKVSREDSSGSIQYDVRVFEVWPPQEIIR